MERNKLIPMVEFVNGISELVPKEIDQNFHRWCARQLLAIDNYAKFLSHPLTLGMLVPCGEDGKPLEESKEEHYNTGDLQTDYNNFANHFNEWQEAKERVMFEGFELKGRELWHNETNLFWVFTSKDFDMSHTTIEQLLNNYKNEIVFTPNALKEIYGN